MINVKIIRGNNEKRFVFQSLKGKGKVKIAIDKGQWGLKASA